MSKPAPVLHSALLISLCTLGSRVTGLARDVLLAQTFGVTWVHDAWNYAFQVPNLFRRLFGEGALAAVFVPLFTRTLSADREARAWRLLAGVLALLSLTLLAVLLVLEGVVLVAWWFTAEGPDAAANALLLSLTGLMLPYMVAICITALFASVLNAVGRFVVPALMPIVLNLAMIVTLVWLAPELAGAEAERQVYVLAGSVLAAGVLQVLILLPVLRRSGVALAWRWQPRDPLVQRAVTLMGPVLLGQGVLALGVFLDAQVCALLTATAADPTANWFGWEFAYPLQAGALTSITVASRLYQFPLGVMAVALGTAVLPTLTRLATQVDWGGWSRELTQTLRMGVFVGLLAGAMLVAIPHELVRLLFEYREFGPQDTDRVAAVLRWYGLGMWALFGQHLVVRAFYSLGDVKTPLKISVLLLPFNLAISLVLIWQPAFREAGFAVSSTLTATLAVAAGSVLLRREVTGLDLRPLAIGAVPMLLAAVVAGSAAYGVVELMDAALAGVTDNLGRRLLVTFGGLAAGGGVFVGLAAALRLPEASMLLRRLMRLSRGAS